MMECTTSSNNGCNSNLSQYFNYNSIIDLYSNNDGYELMKQYNQLIKQHKQYLEDLEYYHSRIGGYKNANTKQKIEQLIDKVDK